MACFSLMSLSLYDSNWSWETDRKIQPRLTSPLQSHSNTLSGYPPTVPQKWCLTLHEKHYNCKNAFLSSVTGSKRRKYCCCYTPLWPPIKDAGDGCRRGCQSGRGLWGEQKAGGGVAQPWPGHNDQDLTLQTYHHTHASNHDAHTVGVGGVGGEGRQEVSWTVCSCNSVFSLKTPMFTSFYK